MHELLKLQRSLAKGADPSLEPPRRLRPPRELFFSQGVPTLSVLGSDHSVGPPSGNCALSGLQPFERVLASQWGSAISRNDALSRGWGCPKVALGGSPQNLEPFEVSIQLYMLYHKAFPKTWAIHNSSASLYTNTNWTIDIEPSLNLKRNIWMFQFRGGRIAKRTRLTPTFVLYAHHAAKACFASSKSDCDGAGLMLPHLILSMAVCK